MRETKKEQIINVISVLKEVHIAMSRCIEKNNIQSVLIFLEDCQEAAIAVGSQIEKTEGSESVAVSLLEQYCEMTYQFHKALKQMESIESEERFCELDDLLEQIIESIHQDIKVKREIVFLPYKASMWDSLESVWKAAEKDQDCEVYVIPIPYFDRNADGSFGEMHYEGELYPDEVPITHYKAYDLEERRPDVIYIHNPYDEYNRVTSVHPDYYSKKLKKYTESLIYIPYFVLCETDPENEADVEGIAHFILTPGVLNADKTIVQSNTMKQIYVNVLAKEFGEATRDKWNTRIEGSGSPKFDKVLNLQKENLKIPEEWLRVIEKSDKSWKKIIFYNTSLIAFLQYNDVYLDKLENVLSVFRENKNEIALLWRPHPLMKNTIESMRPNLKERYLELVQRYKVEGWGIYDDSVEFDRAIGLSDAYYGDWSSVVELCKKREVPILIQNVKIFE